MFLINKNLDYDDESGAKPSILPMVMCWLWWPTNYDNFRIPTTKCYANKIRTFLTQIIITTFLLKYYDNDKVIADFDLALQDFYKNGYIFLPISELCEKYGRNISLKYAITAYNICLMFANMSDCYWNKYFYTNFSKNIKINKDFINNATSGIIDVSFNEYMAKYNAKPLSYNKIPNEICEMLDNSLTNVERLDFISNNPTTTSTIYDNSLNNTNLIKNIFNKKFGLQVLYCARTLGPVLSYYYHDHSNFRTATTQNLVESCSERFINKIGNIFDKLYVKNGDFTMVNNYLRLFQNGVRYLSRNLNKFKYNEYLDNERLDFSKPYRSDDSFGQLQVDGTSTITKIHKICRLLDYNIIDELAKMPINMWETILDSKNDQFDDIMDEFNLAIINCGNLAFSTTIGDQCWKYYSIGFSNNIVPTNVKIVKEQFCVYRNASDIAYIIPLFVNLYEYFNVVDDAETETMVENRLKLVKNVEKCLENMKKLANIKQVKENIKVTIEDY